jgi:hypothetical protein
MKTYHVRFLALLVVLGCSLLFGVAGCTHVQVAPDTLGEYKFGELQVWSDRDFATVYNATKAAFKDLKLFQTQDDRKIIEADVRGRDNADTLVIVKIKEVAKGRTSVKIRYGLKGDLALAQKVYQSIQKNY